MSIEWWPGNYPSLMPGEPDIKVFADASADYKLGIGSWAYVIPAFGVYGSGIECGGHVEQYELAGAVSGIEAAARIDASMRPIHISTDSDFVVAVLKHLGKTRELPLRQSYKRVRELAQRTLVALGPRMISVSKCAGDANHQRCHVTARKNLRKYCYSDSRARQGLAIKREERRLSSLLKRWIVLEKQLQLLETELAISDFNLRAIRDVKT